MREYKENTYFNIKENNQFKLKSSVLFATLH